MWGNISHDVHIHIEKDEDLQTFIHTIWCAHAKRVRDGLGWYLLGARIEQDHLEMRDQCLFLDFYEFEMIRGQYISFVTHPFVFILFVWFMNSTNIRLLSCCRLYETTKKECVATTMHRRMDHTLTCGNVAKVAIWYHHAHGKVIANCSFKKGYPS